MNEAISTLKTWIEASSRIVFFGGAGVSTVIGYLVQKKRREKNHALNIISDI